MNDRASLPDDPAPPGPGEVTLLLARLGEANGTDAAVYDRLLPLIYDELRRLAGSFLDRERPDHTLQPTALVNEAFLRLARQANAGWESKGHFFAIAATAMRRILVDHARARKRRLDPDRQRHLLESDVTAANADDLDLVALDEAMEKLGRFDARKVKVVELRYFVGLDLEQTAAALGVSVPTVSREWRMARVWLKREIGGDG